MRGVSSSGESNPFEGMPFFGDLAEDARPAGPHLLGRAPARSPTASPPTGEPEPNVDPLARIQLEQLARVAELQVADATGLEHVDTGRPDHDRAP